MANMIQPERLRAECPNCKRLAWFVLSLPERADADPGGSWTCQACGYTADYAQLDPLPQ